MKIPPVLSSFQHRPTADTPALTFSMASYPLKIRENLCEKIKKENGVLSLRTLSLLCVASMMSQGWPVNTPFTT
jgi:hypothetical protein